MRKVIIDERPMNPKYYDRMSELLDALLEERRKGPSTTRPTWRNCWSRPLNSVRARNGVEYPTGPTTAPAGPSYDFFFRTTAMEVDRAVRHTKPDSWVGNAMKEKKVKRAIRRPARSFDRSLDELFELVKARNEYR